MRDEGPNEINPRGDKSLCLWGVEEYVSKAHSSPMKKSSGVMTIAFIHISLDPRCWDTRLIKKLIADLFRFTFLLLVER